MIPRRHSTEEHLVDGRHRSSSRRRGHGLIAADGHRCSSNHIDQENNDDYDHHEYYYSHCQYQPANNNISEAVPDELDFRDVFGGPPRSTTNILLRRCGFSGDLGTTSATTASAGGTRSLTNFYDEIFCPVLRASHLHPDYHQSDPDPNSRHEDPGGRSVLGDGCFLHFRAKMRNNSRKPVRIGRNLPGFDIPSSSFSFSLAEEEMRRTSEEKEAEFFMKTEDGFYDDIFRSSSNGNGSEGDRRSSRTCNCVLSKSAKSRSKYKSKASAGSSTLVLSSDQDVHVTSPPSHVIRSSIHNENNMTMSTSASAAYRHHGRRKEEEDAIFSSFASKLRPITIPSKSTCRSSRGYDSSPAPSTILSAEEDVNERRCSQRTSVVSINPLSATTFMDLCSTSSSPPLPPSSSDHHVKKSSVNSNLFQHYHCWYDDQPNSSTTTESTTPAILFSVGLTKPRPNPSFSASASGGRSASTTIYVANGSVGDDVCDYAPRSPSSVISSVFLEPLATNAAQTPAQDKRITEKKVLVAQEGDHEIGACESDQNDSESSLIKDIEYINCGTRTHAMTMGGTEGAAAVDEAIAWAKEKFWNGSGPTAGV